MRLLVTGASGFLGRNLLLALPAEWDIAAAYRGSPDFPAFLARHGLEYISPIQTDLASANLHATFGGAAFDACVYLAANGDPARSTREPREDLASNTLGLVGLLEVIRTPHLVFFSSGAVYDGLQGTVTPATPVAPTLPYAISKLASEHYVRHFVRQGSLQTATIVRFFGAFGPHEPPRKIYSRLVRAFALAREPAFTIRGDGRNLIDAMYVDDAVAAVRLLLDRPPDPGESCLLDLHAAAPMTLRALVETAARTFDLEPVITCEGSVPEYIEFRSIDDTMRETHGFVPHVSLEEGLRRLAAHLRAEEHDSLRASAG
jgi:nucleoside-diphosphate-sugar epimerase